MGEALMELEQEQKWKEFMAMREEARREEEKRCPAWTRERGKSLGWRRKRGRWVRNGGPCRVWGDGGEGLGCGECRGGKWVAGTDCGGVEINPLPDRNLLHFRV